MNEEEFKRDEKGDVKLNLGTYDWEKKRRWDATYVFHYWDKARERYMPYFDIDGRSDEKLEEARSLNDFRQVELYKSPKEPPYDFSIQYHNWQLALLVEYFKEIFDEKAFVQGHIPRNKYFYLIMPRQIHEQMLNVINDYGLLPIRDLLLEVIARAQEIYTKVVYFWETPQMKKVVDTAEKEAKKAIELIDRIDSFKGLHEGEPPAELLRINFIFADKTIKMEHPWLAREFIEGFRDRYSDGAYKNYRLELERYAHSIEGRDMGQFKFLLARAFYHLLTKGEFYLLQKQKPYPNELMLCIAKLVEFCQIPVGSPGETDELKIKHIRNWIKRHEIREAITYAQIPFNRPRLLKYFEEDFINRTGEQKRADAMVVASYLAKRFGLGHLIEDLAHIAQALREGSLSWGHQLFYQGGRERSLFPEYDGLRKLIMAIKQQKKITSLKFSIEGQEGEHSFVQRLPLYFLEQAFSRYIEDHQVEMDTDVIKQEHQGNEGSDAEPMQFNQPEERLSVKFVKAFYNYLLAEAPPAENDWMPSENYYKIIAAMLQHTWFFYQIRDPEWFLVERVKRWHLLS